MGRFPSAHVSDADKDVAHGCVGVGGKVDDLVYGEPLVLGRGGGVPEKVVEEQPGRHDAKVLNRWRVREGSNAA